MYIDHFSLDVKPFQITSDPKFLWLGEKHKEALATLRYGILDNRGFLLMTGEVGTGKTVLINCLIKLLAKNTVVANLKDPDLDGLDFYNVLASEFNINKTFASKGQFLILFRKFLERCHKNRQQVLLIIDESQRLSHKLMEDIRTLSNIELHNHKLINIFFVGQQEFNNILMTPDNRALSQRITVRYHIDPLEEEETAEYIRHRLKVAGTQKQIFDTSAVSEIFKISRGLPRLINIICDHALLTAFTLNVHSVDGKIIEECAEELRIPLHAPKVAAASFWRGEVQPPEEKKPNSADDIIPASAPADHIAKAGFSVIHPGEMRSFRWSRWLSNLTAIIIIIGVLTYFVDRYLGNSIPNPGNDHSTTQENSGSSGLKKGQPQNAQPGTAQPDSRRGQSANVSADGEATASVRRAPASSVPAIEGTPNQSSGLPNNGIGATLPAADKNKTEKTAPLTQSNVLIPFAISSNDIDASSYGVLDHIAGYLAQFPEMVINVRGYTDNRGVESYNERMSLFRANVVKSYLIGKGVSPDRIVIHAMGGANPIASNDSMQGRRKNRRVEIELLSKQ